MKEDEAVAGKLKKNRYAGAGTVRSGLPGAILAGSNGPVELRAGQGAFSAKKGA
jgi:hypothetical protein